MQLPDQDGLYLVRPLLTPQYYINPILAVVFVFEGLLRGRRRPLSRRARPLPRKAEETGYDEALLVDIEGVVLVVCE
jgi:hypothetical protein